MTNNRLIGNMLRKERLRHGWTINDVVIRLRDDYNLNVAKKTIYGWESDQSYPRTESLLILCEMYRIEDIATGLLKAPAMGNFQITADEREVIIKYRQHPRLQSVVKRVLDAPEEEDSEFL
jgi:transcriptional regulator with XRE-family HTH domain